MDKFLFFIKRAFVNFLSNFLPSKEHGENSLHRI